jgi:hypothetical protein
MTRFSSVALALTDRSVGAPSIVPPVASDQARRNQEALDYQHLMFSTAMAIRYGYATSTQSATSKADAR